MSGVDTVLCIHRDPGQLSVLRRKGYGLVTATNGSEGLRLLMSKSVDAVLLELVRTIATRRGDHDRECAPVWISRNGNDLQGMFYVVLTCVQCLRAFQMNLLEESRAETIQIPCRFCGNLNRYFIQPALGG